MELFGHLDNTSDSCELELTVGGARPKSLPGLPNIPSESDKSVSHCSKSSHGNRSVGTDKCKLSLQIAKQLKQSHSQHQHPYPLEDGHAKNVHLGNRTNPYCLGESKHVCKKSKPCIIGASCNSPDECSIADDIDLFHEDPSLQHCVQTSDKSQFQKEADPLSEWRKTGITLRRALLNDSTIAHSEHDLNSGMSDMKCISQTFKTPLVSNNCVTRPNGETNLTDSPNLYKPDCVTEICSFDGDREIKLHLIDDNLDDVSFKKGNKQLEDSSFHRDIRRNCDTLCHPDGLCMCFNLISDSKHPHRIHSESPSMLENVDMNRGKSVSPCKSTKLDGAALYNTTSSHSTSPHKTCVQKAAKQFKSSPEFHTVPSPCREIEQYGNQVTKCRTGENRIITNRGSSQLDASMIDRTGKATSSQNMIDSCCCHQVKHASTCKGMQQTSGRCHSKSLQISPVSSNFPAKHNDNSIVDWINRKKESERSPRVWASSRPTTVMGSGVLNTRCLQHKHNSNVSTTCSDESSATFKSSFVPNSSDRTNTLNRGIYCSKAFEQCDRTNSDIRYTNNRRMCDNFVENPNEKKNLDCDTIKPAKQSNCVYNTHNPDKRLTTSPTASTDRVKSCNICPIIPLTISHSRDSTSNQNSVIDSIHWYCYSHENNDQFTYPKKCPISPRRPLAYLDMHKRSVLTDTILSSSNESDSTLEDVSVSVNNEGNMNLAWQDEIICSSSDNDVGNSLDGNLPIYGYTTDSPCDLSYNDAEFGSEFVSQYCRSMVQDESDILKVFQCCLSNNESLEENKLVCRYHNLSCPSSPNKCHRTLLETEKASDNASLGSKDLFCCNHSWKACSTKSPHLEWKDGSICDFCYQINSLDHNCGPECSFYNNSNGVCPSVWADSMGCHDSRTGSNLNVDINHSDTSIGCRLKNNDSCSDCRNSLHSPSACGYNSSKLLCSCVKNVCESSEMSRTTSLAEPISSQTEFGICRCKCYIGKDSNDIISPTAMSSPVKEVRSVEKNQECLAETLLEKVTSSGTDEISNSERLTDSNITDSSSMYESVYVPQKHSHCASHCHAEGHVRSPSHTGKHCVHSHRERSPFRKKRKDSALKSRKKDAKNVTSCKTTIDSSTDCEQIEHSEPPSPETVSPVNLDTLCGATSLTFSSDDFDYFEDDIFADFTNEDTAVSLTPEEADCTLVNKSFISALHYALPYLPDKYKTCLPKSPDHLSRGPFSQLKNAKRESVDKSPSLEGFLETSPESEESDAVIPNLTQSSDDSDADADDEFECDCEHCQLSSTHDFHSEITQVSLDGQDPTNDIDIRDSELDQRESGLYRISVDELSPLEFVLMRQDARRDMLEQMFQNFIMQMLAVHPDLLNDQAPPPASQEALNALSSTVVSQLHVDEELSCPICLCACVLGERLCCLPCQHLFHVLCIHAWLKKSGTCPVCRNIL